MQRLLLLLAAIFFINVSTSSELKAQTRASHDKWDQLLQKHVDQNGLVNYKGMKADLAVLDDYLNLLSSNHPDKATWSEKEQLAYWINAYNAFTEKLILDNYPVESIKDIGSSINIPFVNTPWDIKFINIGDEEYDLNNIEHGIIRKEFDEPRIHFALVCAAISCPRLRNEAYTHAELNVQLEEEARFFFNNPAKNNVSKESMQLSKLMSWYWGDFKGQAKSRAEYVNRYSDVKANPDADVDFLDYNWTLNEQ